MTKLPANLCQQSNAHLASSRSTSERLQLIENTLCIQPQMYCTHTHTYTCAYNAYSACTNQGYYHQKTKTKTELFITTLETRKWKLPASKKREWNTNLSYCRNKELRCKIRNCDAYFYFNLARHVDTVAAEIYNSQRIRACCMSFSNVFCFRRDKESVTYATVIQFLYSLFNNQFQHTVCY